jgi:hypothetical protein
MRSVLYTCVNCGNQVQELFKQYSPSVLKLVHCVGEIPRHTRLRLREYLRHVIALSFISPIGRKPESYNF